VDLSGLTVMLGAGTGQLARVLDEQIRLADGQLMVADYGWDVLQAMAFAGHSPHITLVRARLRETPVLAETVDLLVLNGSLRQVPVAHLGEMAEELWRLLTPGGRLRISDIIEPTDAPYDAAWTERNRLVRLMASAFGRPTAIAVDLVKAAAALTEAGFENLAVSLLPGLLLSPEWLENTISSVRTMAARLGDRRLREQVLGQDLARLQEAFAAGQQRAAERFVLRGNKPGELALDMEASFVEEDLWVDGDE
jgi:SAM-dependent methyltransferase